MAEYNETLSMLATVYKNKATGAFVERNVNKKRVNIIGKYYSLILERWCSEKCGSH